ARVVNVTVRGKNAGRTRPSIVSRAFSRFAGGNVPSDALVPYTIGQLRFPADFDTSFAGAGQGSNVDSGQGVYEIQDIAEVQSGGPAPFKSAFPYLDNLSVSQVLADTDHDGVPDVKDACPSLSAIGEDADGDGCPDATASLHHVRTWAIGDRP